MVAPSTPWAQLTGEPEKAYRMFSVYLALESPSIRAAYETVCEQVGRKRSKKTPGYVNHWSSRFDWVRRRAAYYADIEERQRQEIEKAGLRRAGQLGERLGSMRVDLVDCAEQMIGRCRDMLRHPLTEGTRTEETRTEEKDKDGNVVAVTVHQHITIKPARWNLGTVATMANAASTVLELAEQTMAADSTERHGKTNKENLARFRELIAEEKQRIKDRETVH